MRCSCGTNRLYRCIAVRDALGLNAGELVTVEAMSWLEILRAQSDTSSGKSGNSYTNEEKYVK